MGRHRLGRSQRSPVRKRTDALPGWSGQEYLKSIGSTIQMTSAGTTLLCTALFTASA